MKFDSWDDVEVVDLEEEPPPGYTEQQWRELCCCACNGCWQCEHDCGLPAEEAQKRHERTRAMFDEMARRKA
jgi:hypothetical protein